MSDKRQELLRRLQESQRLLESAHTDYLKANTESQKALGRVLDAFGEMADTVREVISDEESTPSVVISPEIPVEPQEQQEQQVPQPSPAPMIRSTPSSQVDQKQNTLPARLHSRGVSIPPREEGQPRDPEPAESPTPPGRTSPRGLYLETPTLLHRPPKGAPFPGLQKDRKVVVTNDGFGVAPILNDLLSGKGYRVRTEGRLADLNAPADVVIFLGSLRAPSNLDDAMAVVEDAMKTVEKMTTRLMQPGSGFIAAVDTAGGFGLDNFDPVAAPFGALLGLIRLIDERHPGADTKLIDLDGGQLQAHQIAELLAEELLNGEAESPVALARGERRVVQWTEFQSHSRPALWLEEDPAPLVYLPGPEAILSTAVERLAIAHELPVAVLRRPGVSAKLIRDLNQLDLEVRSTDYDLNRLFSVMDFFDRLRADHGPIGAVITESFPAQNREDLARWSVARPALDEFNALLAITINDPLHLLGVGLGPNTPPVVASALRYFARAESLRRNEHLHVRLAHLKRRTPRQRRDLDPSDFALTEFLSASEPSIAEVRLRGKTQRNQT